MPCCPVRRSGGKKRAGVAFDNKIKGKHGCSNINDHGDYPTLSQWPSPRQQESILTARATRRYNELLIRLVCLLPTDATNLEVNHIALEVVASQDGCRIGFGIRPFQRPARFLSKSQVPPGGQGGGQNQRAAAEFVGSP